MDKKYLARLQEMLVDVEERIAKLDEIKDPAEKKAKEKFFAQSKGDLESKIASLALPNPSEVNQIGVVDDQNWDESKINSQKEDANQQEEIRVQLKTEPIKIANAYVVVNGIKVPIFNDEMMEIKYQRTQVPAFKQFKEEDAFSKQLLSRQFEMSKLYQLVDERDSLREIPKYDVPSYVDIAIEPYQDGTPVALKQETMKQVEDSKIESAVQKNTSNSEQSFVKSSQKSELPIVKEQKNDIISQNEINKNEQPKSKIEQKEVEKPMAKDEVKNHEEELSEKQKKELKSETKQAKKEARDFERDPENTEFIKVELPEIKDAGVKALKQIQKRQKQLTSKYSKQILNGAVVTTTNYQPNYEKHVIELNDVTKSYLTGDVETQVLKGIDIKLNKSDFIVILGPSGSGKTTFLNIISGLDKATKGDVFVLGYNLSLLKDSHLTKFRRKHVGFIFQQYNLLTNLTAKENAEVGENLSTKKHADMSIEDIFETIGMKDQMNKYPHQMSGGQQQRVSIARALAKNPDILFADEPTGALDEEMGRKVLEILVDVNKRYKTTVIVVTHNPNIAKIGNTVIHIKNGLIDSVVNNPNPADPQSIDWS